MGAGTNTLARPQTASRTPLSEMREGEMTHYNMQIHLQEVTEAEFDNYGKPKSAKKVIDVMDIRLTANRKDDLIDKANKVLDMEKNL